MKILKIKEYITEQNSDFNFDSPDNIDEKVNKAFSELLKDLRSDKIKYNPNESGCFCTKLKTRITSKMNRPNGIALKVYTELSGMISENGVSQIIVKHLQVSPLIYNPEESEPERAVMAYLKFI